MRSTRHNNLDNALADKYMISWQLGNNDPRMKLNCLNCLFMLTIFSSFCSDFQMFTHGNFGNCYVFNAHVEGSEKRILKRGGTDIGMKVLSKKEMAKI